MQSPWDKVVGTHTMTIFGLQPKFWSEELFLPSVVGYVLKVFVYVISFVMGGQGIVVLHMY